MESFLVDKLHGAIRPHGSQRVATRPYEFSYCVNAEKIDYVKNLKLMMRLSCLQPDTKIKIGRLFWCQRANSNLGVTTAAQKFIGELGPEL